MNKMFVIICVLLLGWGLNGCAQSPVASISNAPGISNLVISPTSSTVGAGGGAITVTAYIDFADKDGDLSILTLKTAAGETKGAITGTDGLKTGTVYSSVMVSTATSGSFTFEVWVIDKANNSSNHLSGVFPIL